MSFTGRLSLNVRSLLAAAENKWAVLLRFVEPLGLRAGPSAHPRSAQPETGRIGAENWVVLWAVLVLQAGKPYPVFPPRWVE